jgi:predicted ATPase
MNKQTHWYSLYNDVVVLLQEFYSLNQENSGTELYKLLTSNIDFLNKNNWLNEKSSTILKFKKFSNTKDEFSITPLQLIASFNDYNLDDNQRTDQIRLIFDILYRYLKNHPTGLSHMHTILGSELLNELIITVNYAGWVGFNTKELLRFRQIKEQQEIWKHFYKMTFEYSAKQFSEESFVFESMIALSWYNMSVKSLTTYLFWINSDAFFPLSNNITNLLNLHDSTNLITSNIDIYANYIGNNKEDLYRKIVKYSNPDFNQLYSDEEDIKNNISLSVENHFNIERSNENRGDFRILAIKLDKTKSPNFNSLKEGELYEFYDCYKFRKDKDKEVIKYSSDKDCSLYHLDSGLNISISAIVGKNGSGKSTLFELIFRVIYNISFKLKFIQTPLHIDNKEIKLDILKDINVELYIKSNGIYKIQVNRGDIKLFRFKEDKGSYYLINHYSQEINLEFLREFCYSIAINYSAYSLNSKQIGDWISALFHKNDSYQTPIVIEPYRKFGNIDINTQNGLVKARMLSNIVEKEFLTEDRSINNSFRRITEESQEKKFSEVHYIELSKRDRKFKTFPNTDTLVFKCIVEELNSKLEKDFFNIENLIKDESIKLYILHKLLTISERYPNYSVFDLRNSDDIQPYVRVVLEDRSHVTYKVRQAIFYSLLDLGKIYKTSEKIDINQIADEIEDIKEKYLALKIATIDLLPPPIFKVEIILENEKNEEYSIEKLSSGEKQLMYSINSILYHLKNLESVFLSNSKLVKYSKVNILLDEVELYFHPEMQRQYLSYLLAGLNRLKLNHILAINICIITHSPYLLSDIPETNILFLDNNGEINKNKPKTFGANIHDLLINGFFMNNSKGSLVLDKIKKIILFHEKISNEGIDKYHEEYRDKRQEFFFIKNAIGEGYVKGVINNHLMEIERLFMSNEYAQREIDILEEKIKLLKKKLHVKS